MTIQRYDAFYPSTNGNTQIHASIWRDTETEPDKLLQIVHGNAEHILRYDGFARFFASKGFCVFGNDHLGHGRSLKAEDRLGDYGDINDDIRLVDDVNRMNRIMRKKYPDLPCIVLGHSLGSLVARILTVDFPAAVDALILSGTAQLASFFSYAEPLIGLAGDLTDRGRYPSGAFDPVGILSEKYYRENDPMSWLSRSSENRAEFEADPLCGSPITTGSTLNMAKLALKCSAPSWFSSFPTDVPVLNISGGKDAVGAFGRGIISLDEKLSDLGVYITTKIYPGLRHEILNEDNKDEIYAEILNWINSL